MIYRQSKTFRESFSGLDEDLKSLAKEKFALFVKNPHHPSLKTHKMEGKKDIYEGHVTKSCVFTFRYIKDDLGNTICESIDIGTHDIYD